MTVASVEVNGQTAQFKFVQPTYPGDPNGDSDPDALAHRTGQSYPINADNPNPPACASTSPDPEFQNLPCPANKLVVTPTAPIPAGTSVKVEIDYTGRPGVHSDGDETTEGWFRSNNPVNDGGFVTTEPMGTEDWMPLNDHPTAKPTYDFTTVTNIDRTAISNGQLVSHTTTAADPQFPGAPGSPGDPNANPPVPAVPAQPAGSATWVWHMPNPVQDYLVENSVGYYSNGYDDGVHGGVKIGAAGTLYYEFQRPAWRPTEWPPTRPRWTCRRTSPPSRASSTGRSPHHRRRGHRHPVGQLRRGDGDEDHLAGGRISLGTFNHENMHQWWGDNVAASLTRYTFLKEGMATLGEDLNTARTAATNAGGYGTPAGNAAFDASMVSQFNSTYASGTTPRTAAFWTEVPSNPTPNTLFDNPPTYARPGASYVALRQILGDDRFITALHGIQHDFGGGNISEAQMEAQYHSYIPNQSAACSAKLDQFFTQWWDTSYAPGGGANRPQITGPGLAGGGFYDASGPCSSKPARDERIDRQRRAGALRHRRRRRSGRDVLQPRWRTVPDLQRPGAVDPGDPHGGLLFHRRPGQPGGQPDGDVHDRRLDDDDGGRHRAGHAGADAGRAGRVRHLHAGRDEGLLGVHDGHGRLLRRRRGAQRVRPGHGRARALVNGTFALPSALTTSAGAVSGTPLTLKTWSAPVSNDQVAVTFGQHIGSTDPLRTGTYAKTLTFTLSTTTP